MYTVNISTAAAINTVSCYVSHQGGTCVSEKKVLVKKVLVTLICLLLCFCIDV